VNKYFLKILYFVISENHQNTPSFEQKTVVAPLRTLIFEVEQKRAFRVCCLEQIECLGAWVWKLEQTYQSSI